MTGLAATSGRGSRSRCGRNVVERVYRSLSELNEPLGVKAGAPRLGPLWRVARRTTWPARAAGQRPPGLRSGLAVVWSKYFR